MIKPHFKKMSSYIQCTGHGIHFLFLKFFFSLRHLPYFAQLLVFLLLRKKKINCLLKIKYLNKCQISFSVYEKYELFLLVGGFEMLVNKKRLNF